MKNLTPELIAKAKEAKSAEELFALAGANGVEITEEEANTYFAQLNANGAVSDDELDLVAGGCGEETYKLFKLAANEPFRFLDDTRCPICQCNRARKSERGAQCLNCRTDYVARVTVDNIELI